MVEPTAPPEPPPVVVLVPPPERQLRATIAFRAVLAVPAGVVLWVASIVAFVVGVVGWVLAVALGCLPGPFHRFMCRWLRLTAHVYGYALLLTDRYPPLLPGPEYGVDVVCPERPRLSRVAVLLRLLLVIPAAVVATVAMFGLSLFLFGFWLIALVRGGLPDAVHQAIAATVRYLIRYTAYFSLVTPAYPRGLFGDRVRGEAAADDRGTLPLTRSGKRLLGAMVAIGTLTYGGVVAVAVASGGFDRLGARVELAAAYESFNDAGESFQEDMQECQGAADPVLCATGALRIFGEAAAEFHDDVAGIDFPTSADDEAAELLAAAAAFRDAANNLAGATSAADYAERAQRSDFETIGTRFEAAYAALLDALS